MSTEKTEGLVIRQADWSETSRVVTMFTRDFGKVSMIAKGARRLKGPFDAAIDLLAACRIVFLRKSTSSLDILTEAQLLSRFQPASRNLFGLYGGYYVAELLNGLTEEYDPHPALYDQSLATLERLSEDDDPKTALLRFQLVVLREIGQLPNFDESVVSGEAADEGSFALWVSQGGLLRQEERPERYRDRGPLLDAGTLAVLRRLSDADERAARRTRLSPNQQKSVQRILTAAISHALGRRPKTLRFLPF